MITISQIIEDIISKSPLLNEILYGDMANISSIARQLRPQVEKKLLEDVSEDAVSMSLRRIKKKLKPIKSGTKFLKDLNNITVRSNLIEFVFLNPSNSVNVHKDLLRQIENKKDVFFNLSTGLFESIIVINNEYEKETTKILKNVKKTIIKDLSSITIKLSEETITTPGVYYLVLKALAWNGVNIIEVISIGTELSIILKNTDADKAFSVIKALTQ
jgi:aspartokinase